jgi:hypothetical protein
MHSGAARTFSTIMCTLTARLTWLRATSSFCRWASPGLKVRCRSTFVGTAITQAFARTSVPASVVTSTVDPSSATPVTRLEKRTSMPESAIIFSSRSFVLFAKVWEEPQNMKY